MRRLLVVLAFLAAAALAQTTNWQASYSKRDVMIPMRDGVRLHTEIYVPRAAHAPLPFLITRTPYGTNDNAAGYSNLLRSYPVMVQQGYLFVMQDIRGRYKSEGRFVMQRPPRDRSDPHSIDEATDTYDTIAWLLKNVPNNNGRAGLLGISYGGWLTTMALLEPHPALKAVSEQASPADMFLGDDFHHNGAFRLSYGFEYAAMMETGKTNFRFQFPVFDTYSWYLNLGSLANVNKNVLHGSLPTWNNFVAHPNYDSFWQQQAFYPYLKDMRLSVPDLNVAGWWDQEDFYGPVTIYETLAPHDVHHYDYLVVGPWNHGGWSHGQGDALGPVKFGSDTSAYFRAQIQAPWFAYWLKGEGTLPARVRTFATGSNQWQSYSAWPPEQGVQKRALYMQADHALSFAAPTSARAYDSYVSDPAHPVAYRHRPIQETYGSGSQWYTWLTEDQRFVQNRSDTLSWTGAVLQQPVCIAGDITADLYASTSGSDSDWIAKLIDVYPQSYAQEGSMAGYELMIADEVFRGRFRTSFEHPAPIPPNQVELYQFSLHTNDHCFLPGHQIMVQVQSSWFPLIDRNPQTFVPNIFLAKAGDFHAATQRIWRSQKYPSHIELPVRAPAAAAAEQWTVDSGQLTVDPPLAPTPAPAVADGSSPAALLAALNAVISGPAGPRDWDRFRKLWLPGARIQFARVGRDGKATIATLTPEDYVQRNGPYFATHAFYETTLVARSERFGNIAQIWTSFALRSAPSGPPTQTGVESCQLLFDGQRWWFANLLDQPASAALPLPSDLAGSPPR